VKFLAITASNLDEYVEIRQAGLMQRIEDGYRAPGFDGLRPDESLAVLTADIHSFVDAQYRCWNDQLLPELRKQAFDCWSGRIWTPRPAPLPRITFSAKWTRC